MIQLQNHDNPPGLQTDCTRPPLRQIFKKNPTNCKWTKKLYCTFLYTSRFFAGGNYAFYTLRKNFKSEKIFE